MTEREKMADILRRLFPKKGESVVAVGTFRRARRVLGASKEETLP